MLQYFGSVGLLILEMIFCSVIILPIPGSARQYVLDNTARIWNRYPRLRLAVKMINALVFAMFLDACWGVYRSYTVSNIKDPHAAEATGGPGKTITMRLFEAERNMFMSLFILFLFMMIHRFTSMTHEVIVLSDRQTRSQEQKKLSQERDFLRKEKKDLEDALRSKNVTPVTASS
eukprot:TRINITY_DN569_c0_g1_i1.p1 TRINITY_DN569_c0_g1~~TRINITY_DN569_c0_g1_i1.p1  ORF type:complete len:175 (-),score=49.57 TRINITY_DN569_c0_g1_i1:58-582(-)